MPTRRRYDPRNWSAGWWVVIAALVLAGLVVVDQTGKDTDCFPGLPRAVPESAAPGDTVRITASAFPCDRRYHRGALYGLRFRAIDTTEYVDLGSHPVATDGSFEAEVTVPDAAPAGTAHFLVTGFDISDVIADVCDDGSGGCDTYAAGITVRP